MGDGLPKAEKSSNISAEILVRNELAPLPLVSRSRRCLLVLLGSGASFLLGLSGWMVVQARGVTEAAMAAQLHEVPCLQVTCQVREFSSDGVEVEVGEGLALIKADR